MEGNACSFQNLRLPSVTGKNNDLFFLFVQPSKRLFHALLIVHGKYLIEQKRHSLLTAENISHSNAQSQIYLFYGSLACHKKRHMALFCKQVDLQLLIYGYLLIFPPVMVAEISEMRFFKASPTDSCADTDRLCMVSAASSKLRISSISGRSAIPVI